MTKDLYASYRRLLKKEVDGIDYRIVSLSRKSTDLIMAPHGGNIEPQTSQIATGIAADDLSLYLFEGLRKPLKHHELHVTSHKYDEPQALEIVGKSDRTVAVHGRKDGKDPATVWLGGLDTETGRRISEWLRDAGFSTSFPIGKLAGKHNNNICNRNGRSKGVQLEIPKTLRRQLGRSKARMAEFCEAVRGALMQCDEPKGPIKGGCLCGDVRIVAKGPPNRVGICHCLNCRKHHGALFYASAIFPRDAVEITGETGDFEGRHFCPNCGSSVFALSDGEIEVHLGSMDTPDQLTPDYESWVVRRESWLPTFPQMTQYQCDREIIERSEK